MLDVHGFVTPPAEYAGLYKLGDTLARNNFRTQELKDKQDREQLATTKFLANYLDPKDHLTGTQFDPQTNMLLGKAYNQALTLAKQNVPLSDILMATSPLVNQVTDYMQKGQAYTEQKKAALAAIGNTKGIDKNKFAAAMDNMAFPVNPQTGQVDLSQYDPNTNYADKALREGDVYDNTAFDDYVGKSGKNTITDDVRVYGANKSMRKTKASMTMPHFMQPDVDERGAVVGFVPKFDIATDEDNKLIHNFGEQGDHPVRMVTQEVFDSLPPISKAYLRQEVKKYATKFNVPISSSQAENFAKALAYDELKQSGKNYSNLSTQSIDKAAPAPSIKIYNGKNGSDVTINDVYSGIEKTMQDPNTGITEGGNRIATRMNAFNSDAQDVMLNYAKKLTGDNELGNDDVFVTKDTDTGEIKLYKTAKNHQVVIDESHLIGILPKVGTNLKVQAGAKAKQKVVNEGNKLSKKTIDW